MALSGAAFGAAQAVERQQAAARELEQMLVERAMAQQRLELERARMGEDTRQFDVSRQDRARQFDEQMGLSRTQAEQAEANRAFERSRQTEADRVAADTRKKAENKQIELNAVRRLVSAGKRGGGYTPEQAAAVGYEEGLGKDDVEMLDPGRAHRERLEEIRQQGANAIAAANVRGENSGVGSVRTLSVQGPDGQNMTVLVNARGEVVFAGPSQLPAGMKAQAANQDVLLNQIDDLLARGTALKWAGTGMVKAPVQGFVKRATGRGDDQEDLLRIGLDSLKADIAHEKYGAAFTNTERQMLARFAPGSGMDGSAIKNRLEALKRIVNTRLTELSQGKTLTTATPITIEDGSARGRGAGPGSATGPRVGERRMINGTMGEWDGVGWKAVQ